MSCVWLTAGYGARYARSRTRVLLRFRDDVFFQEEKNRARLLFRAPVSPNSRVCVCRASELAPESPSIQLGAVSRISLRFLVIAFQ